MGRLNLLGVQSNLLDGQMPTADYLLLTSLDTIALNLQLHLEKSLKNDIFQKVNSIYKN